MFFSITLGVLFALYVLSRQRRIRPVPRVLSLRFPIVVGVIGLIDVLSYTDTHHPSHGAYLWVLATFVDQFNQRRGADSEWPQADLDEWVQSSPLVRVDFVGAD